MANTTVIPRDPRPAMARHITDGLTRQPDDTVQVDDPERAAGERGCRGGGVTPAGSFRRVVGDRGRVEWTRGDCRSGGWRMPGHRPTPWPGRSAPTEAEALSRVGRRVAGRGGSCGRRPAAGPRPGGDGGRSQGRAIISAMRSPVTWAAAPNRSGTCRYRRHRPVPGPGRAGGPAGPQVADDPQGGQDRGAGSRWVDLPPAEALTGRGGQVVVVVVPSLAAGDHGDDHRVAAGVGGGVARRPIRWAMELTRNVPCQSSTVERKNPMNRPPHPPTRRQAWPAATDRSTTPARAGAARGRRRSP